MKSRLLKRGHPILVIIGPSGAGKSHLARNLEKTGVIELNKSWTTRPMRQGETAESSEHVHVPDEIFLEKARAGFFLDYLKLFGLPYYYGMPKLEQKDPAKAPCIILRANVLPLLQKYYDNSTIYQIETILEIATSRLKDRGDTDREIKGRLSTYEQEIKLGRVQADRIFKNEHQDTSELLEKILKCIKQDFPNPDRKTAT